MVLTPVYGVKIAAVETGHNWPGGVVLHTSHGVSSQFAALPETAEPSTSEA
jgi:hypothetical protein